MKAVSLCRRFLTLAFIVYFSLYVASPLFSPCNYEKKTRTAYAANTGTAFSIDLHIFLYDLIFSMLHSPEHEAASKPLTGVLLLKKRALLPDKYPIKLVRLSYVLVPHAESMSSITRHVDVLFPSLLYSYFVHYVYSGLSPPQSI